MNWILAGAASIFVLIAAGNAPALCAEQGAGKRIAIPISVFSDAQLGGYWTMRMASLLQKKGARVSILLFANGVRLADRRAVDDFGVESEPVPISKRFSDFTAAGGRILVESEYAARVGMTGQTLRDGAEFVDDARMADELLQADQVISF